MKRASRVSAWKVFKRKLKKRYQHLTKADLADIQKQKNSGQWLERTQRRVGGSPFEIALLVEEAASIEKRWPVSLNVCRSLYV